jgi:hypothetical protein
MPAFITFILHYILLILILGNSEFRKKIRKNINGCHADIHVFYVHTKTNKHYK